MSSRSPVLFTAKVTKVKEGAKRIILTRPGVPPLEYLRQSNGRHLQAVKRVNPDTGKVATFWRTVRSQNVKNLIDGLVYKA